MNSLCDIFLMWNFSGHKLCRFVIAALSTLLSLNQ
jgi:hypothetical protein